MSGWDYFALAVVLAICAAYITRSVLRLFGKREGAACGGSCCSDRDNAGCGAEPTAKKDATS